jgi:hypothetical protein
MAGSSPAMTVKGLTEKEIVMPGLDPGIHVRESMPGVFWYDIPLPAKS